MSEEATTKQLTDDRQAEISTDEKQNVKNLAEDFRVRSISSAELIKVENPAAETLSSDENDKDNLSLKTKLSAPNDIDFSEKEINSLIEKSPVFQELFEPKLPELPTENRARLQMQSPNRLYFYWSIKNNPFQTLNRVFGGNAANYALVVKLVNRTQNRVEIIRVEAAGSAWFDVNADSTYRAEIGFYAAHRPFVRLMFSNTVETPRKSPSPRRDFSSDWTVSANQFAQILDVSGYAQNAVEVSLAGDDLEFSDNAARNAFSQVTGNQPNDSTAYDAAEIRFVLLALASGYKPENLRGQISKNLFAKLLETGENLSAEKALDALQENFGEFAEETIEDFGQTVFGASLINFPRFSRRKILPKFMPISSARF